MTIEHIEICNVTKNADFRHLRTVFAGEVYFGAGGIYNK